MCSVPTGTFRRIERVQCSDWNIDRVGDDVTITSAQRVGKKALVLPLLRLPVQVLLTLPIIIASLSGSFSHLVTPLVPAAR